MPYERLQCLYLKRSRSRAELFCCCPQRQGEGPVDVPPLLPAAAADLKDQQRLMDGSEGRQQQGDDSPTSA